MTVGDSEDYKNNTECAVVNGQGYYNCSKPIHGRYITYYSTQNNSNGLFVANFKVWGSENLVPKTIFSVDTTSTEGETEK